MYTDTIRTPDKRWLLGDKEAESSHRHCNWNWKYHIQGKGRRHGGRLLRSRPATADPVTFYK
jgi:hypothetical protein